MNTHTPEPWSIKYEYNVFGRNGERNTASCGSTSSSHHAEQTDIENVANAARIVACVNAMAGIPDPAAFVKSHGELVEALQNFENDDGHTPATIWAIRNAALANAKAAVSGTTEPAKADDWRAKCTVDKAIAHDWNVHSPCDNYYLAASYRGGELVPYWCPNANHKTLEKRDRMGIFVSDTNARIALSKAPKPPEVEP